MDRSMSSSLFIFLFSLNGVTYQGEVETKGGVPKEEMTSLHHSSNLSLTQAYDNHPTFLFIPALSMQVRLEQDEIPCEKERERDREQLPFLKKKEVFQQSACRLGTTRHVWKNPPFYKKKDPEKRSRHTRVSSLHLDSLFARLSSATGLSSVPRPISIVFHSPQNVFDCRKKGEKEGDWKQDRKGGERGGWMACISIFRWVQMYFFLGKAVSSACHPCTTIKTRRIRLLFKKVSLFSPPF